MSINYYSKMKLLVVNLAGPMVKVSYYYTIEHLLYNKEETRPTVQNIIALLEKQSGLKIC